jgi:hypothetical protein
MLSCFALSTCSRQNSLHETTKNTGCFSQQRSQKVMSRRRLVMDEVSLPRVERAEQEVDIVRLRHNNEDVGHNNPN